MRMKSSVRNLALAAAVAVLVPVAIASAVTTGGPVKDRVLDPRGQVIVSGSYEPPVQSISAISCTPGCELWARAGSIDVAGRPVPIWGYATSATGPPTLPGPTIRATAGETVAITLHNDLPGGIDTSLSIPRIPVDDFLGGREGVALPGSTTTVSFKTDKAIGTSMYEAGLTATGNRQVAMGLAGVVVVDPPAALCGQPAPPAPPVRCLYGNPNNTTPPPAQPVRYDSSIDAANDEALVALNDIDPAFAADPLGFDMAQYSARYHLINGKAFPQTDVIDTQAGHVVGLRFANLSPIAHTMGLIGARQNLVGRDANVLAHSRDVMSPLLTPGQTIDASVPVPIDAPAGQRYALYDQGRDLRNGSAPGFGGALTFLNVWGVAGDPAQPVAILNPLAIGTPPSDVTDGSTFSVTGVTPPGAVDGRWYIDKPPDPPAPGAPDPFTHFAVTAGGGSFSATIAASNLTKLANGSHVVWVQLSSTDPGVQWGTPVGVAFSLDRGGPVMSGTSVLPAVSNATSDLVVRTTGATTPTGTANIAEGRFSIDGSCASVPTSGSSMAPDPGPILNAAPVQGFVTSLPAASVGTLAEGVHKVQTAARDALGHWPTSNPDATGATTPLCDETSFTIDKTRPTVTGASIDPNPSNGIVSSFGQVNFLDSLRLTATVTDPLGNGVNTAITRMEAFLDGVLVDSKGNRLALPAGATDGNGIAMQPVDGAWDSPTETAYVYIPLATVRSLTPGDHGIWVHGRDAAGNWGAISGAPDAVLRYIPDAPSVNFLTVNGATLNAGATAALDGVSISAFEYSIGTLPAAPGAGTALALDPGGAGRVGTVTNATIPLPSPTQNVWVRARDSLGRWSAAAALPIVTTAYDGASLNVIATAMTDLSSVEYGFTPDTATASPSAFSTVAGASGPSPLTAPVPAVPAGQMIWLRARDMQGNAGPVISLATPTGLSFTGPVGNKTLSGTARSGTVSIGSVQFVRAAPGASTSPPISGWVAAAPSSGPSPLGFLATGIAGGASNDTNGHVWVRVQDSSGAWGPAVRL